MDFSLFRIKVFKPTQSDMFATDVPAPDLLREGIVEAPTAPLLRGQSWHIGNVEQIDDDGLYFRLGRNSRTRVPLIDEESGDFIETEAESAPNTHVIVDVPLELCAIGHRTTLAANSSSIARQLERLLNRTTTAGVHRVTFAISEISEPEEFLREIERAYAVTSFTVFFTRPNPFDAEQEFMRPMERLTQEANGDSGNTTIKGTSLDPEPLKALTRSAAATGDNASARLRLQQGARPVKRSLKGDTAKISQESVDSDVDKRTLLERLRDRYRRIRGDGRETA